MSRAELLLAVFTAVVLATGCGGGEPFSGSDAGSNDDGGIVFGDGGVDAAEEGSTDASADASHADGPQDAREEAPSCDAGAVVCGGQCVSPNDPAHCGGSCTACPIPEAGTGMATCSNGTCGVSCGGGYVGCNGACLPASDGPSTDPCIINETYGIFVSPAGSDFNAGTQLSPVQTIGHAMDLAKTAGKRVFACGSAGSYGEILTVAPSRDGVSAYGGLDCTTSASQWTYSAADKATLAPAANSALLVSGLTTGVTFEDFGFVSADTSAPGASSIAVFVSSAQNVAFHRVAMTAGNATAGGAAGASGGTGGDPSNHYGGVLDGVTATTTGGAASETCTCPDGTTSSTGGQGGGEVPAQTPGAGTPAYGGGTAGTNGIACGAGGASGGDGNDAPLGTPDAPSNAHGVLGSNAWTAAAGAPASNGKPGQGGGGGGDGDKGTGGGGGGACGGCGGAGGKPGSGGGSSIALVSYQSSVTLVGCALTSKNAAPGGSGGSGEIGQAGGNGGIRFVSACSGGGGGAGAGGNGAQGGAGGLSLGIGYSGNAPSADVTTTIMFGQKGSGGAGGAPGPAAGTGVGQTGAAGAAGAAGVDGVAQNILSL